MSLRHFKRLKLQTPFKVKIFQNAGFYDATLDSITQKDATVYSVDAITLACFTCFYLEKKGMLQPYPAATVPDEMQDLILHI